MRRRQMTAAGISVSNVNDINEVLDDCCEISSIPAIASGVFFTIAAVLITLR